MKNARKTKQPVAGSGKPFTDEDYAYIGRMMADAYAHARRRSGAAADDSPKPSSADRTAFECSALLDLLAGWRAVEQACEEQGSGLLKTTQTQVALEYCTKAETWRRAIAGLERVVGGLASKSNDEAHGQAGEGHRS